MKVIDELAKSMPPTGTAGFRLMETSARNQKRPIAARVMIIAPATHGAFLIVRALRSVGRKIRDRWPASIWRVHRSPIGAERTVTGHSACNTGGGSA